MVRLLSGAIAVLLLLALPVAAEPAAAGDADVPGRLVVRYAPGETIMKETLARLGVRARRGTTIPGVVTLDLPEASVASVRARLEGDPRVVWVEREALVRSFEREPNDPFWADQWGHRKIGAPSVWEHATGSDVKVAVLDTGVDPVHPELSGRLEPGRSFVPGTFTTVDDNGHGTSVAGLVAAEGDNAQGIAGLCWACRIIPVKVLNAAGVGNTTQLAEGIRWAADNGADIVNMSLGAAENSRALDEAVAYAAGKGIMLIAAAGNGDLVTNEGTDQEFYPAADPRVLSVGGTSQSDAPYSWSNHTWVDVAAPGCNITTWLAGSYQDRFCGTSSAAPLVAGAAALILSHTPSATADQVRAALEETALSVTGFRFGRIDLAAAFARFLSAPAAPAPTPAPSPPVREACPPDRVPSAGFSDTRGNAHELQIDCVVWYGVAQGVGGDRYAPGLLVSRAQMASFIARALERAGVPLSDQGGNFDDISGNPHESNINKLANAGVVQGTGPRTYSPNANVRRDQMASFLVRAYELAGEQLSASRHYFSDTRGNPHEQNIDKAAEAGLVLGTSPGVYSPGAAVRRDQMASFVARTLDLLVRRGHMEPN